MFPISRVCYITFKNSEITLDPSLASQKFWVCSRPLELWRSSPETLSSGKQTSPHGRCSWKPWRGMLLSGALQSRPWTQEKLTSVNLSAQHASALTQTDQCFLLVYIIRFVAVENDPIADSLGRGNTTLQYLSKVIWSTGDNFSGVGSCLLESKDRVRFSPCRRRWLFSSGKMCRVPIELGSQVKSHSWVGG